MSKALAGALFICISAALIATTSARAQEGADAAKGKPVYQMFCVTCHGEAGDGQGPVGKTLNPPPRDFTQGDFKYGGSDQDIYDVITNGAAAKGGSALMAPWGPVINEGDRWSIVKYIRTLKK
jgi:mono/diheme cytochrome c family protein